jgi:ubiquinone/menaquinone biosynthesis C-methylase UbiE
VSACLEWRRRGEAQLSQPEGRPTVAAVQAYFAPRAAGWEERFPNDGPKFARAVGELGPMPGAAALDVGCGTGRAIPGLRDAVGPAGRVVALDATVEMVSEARRLGRGKLAELLVADVHELPLADGSFDLVFAGGLLPHLDRPDLGLAELVRVARPGAQLVVFHVLSRAGLAARHGGVPSDDDVLAPTRLRELAAAAGWRVESIEDGERYLARAVRTA